MGVYSGDDWCGATSAKDLKGSVRSARATAAGKKGGVVSGRETNICLNDPDNHHLVVNHASIRPVDNA